MKNRVEMFEELFSKLNDAASKNEILMGSDEANNSYNHLYMSMIASSLCNISDKLDILVEKMEELDQDEPKAEPRKSEDDNAEQTYSGRGVKIYKEEIEDNY